MDLDKLYFFLNSTRVMKIALSLLSNGGEGGGDLDPPDPHIVHVLSFDKMSHKDISNVVYMYCINIPVHVLKNGNNTSHNVKYHKL